jgi:alpha-galactosidase
MNRQPHRVWVHGADMLSWWFDDNGGRYRTQRFAEAVLAKPAPDPENFPYVAWDSFGYDTKVDEATLRRNAEIAAKIGVELFVLDLGWAKSIGDWVEDPRKSPSGLRALSDYVHSLGMKFGLHFPLAEAAPDAPVLRQNPDWTSSESYSYYGARSLCLSHQPAIPSTATTPTRWTGSMRWWRPSSRSGPTRTGKTARTAGA